MIFFYQKTCLKMPTVPSNIYPFAILLEVLSYFFYLLVWCMFLVVIQYIIAKFFFSLSSPLKIIAWPPWFVGISTSVLIFFIFNFWSWLFWRSFIGFQFLHSIQIEGIMIFNLVLIILISNFFFLALLWKLLFFSMSSFN